VNLGGVSTNNENSLKKPLETHKINALKVNNLFLY
jgi:hypothetical protein